MTSNAFRLIGFSALLFASAAQAVVPSEEDFAQEAARIGFPVAFDLMLDELPEIERGEWNDPHSSKASELRTDLISLTLLDKQFNEIFMGKLVERYGDAISNPFMYELYFGSYASTARLKGSGAFSGPLPLAGISFQMSLVPSIAKVVSVDRYKYRRSIQALQEGYNVNPPEKLLDSHIDHITRDQLETYKSVQVCEKMRGKGIETNILSYLVNSTPQITGVKYSLSVGVFTEGSVQLITPGSTLTLVITGLRPPRMSLQKNRVVQSLSQEDDR